MTTLGVIPARKGSERFPGKHHVPLLGIPMFAYTLEAARRAQRLDRVVVSSDDLALKPLAERYGVEFIERPAELCTETALFDDALRHACRFLEGRDGFRADVVVAMQGNVPVRKSGQIDAVVHRLEELPQATSVCTAQVVRERPEWFKRMKEEQSGQAIPFMDERLGYRTQDLPPLFRIDGAILAIRLSILYAQEGKRTVHAWLGERIHLMIQDHSRYSLEVDYPDQAALAEWHLLCERYGERWYEDAPCRSESGTG